MVRVSMEEAARLTGVPKLEIVRHIHSTRLRVEKGRDGKNTIDRATLRGINGYVPPVETPPPRSAAEPRADNVPPHPAEPEPDLWEPGPADILAIVKLDDAGRGRAIAALIRQHPHLKQYFKDNPLPPVHKRAAPPAPSPPPTPEPVSPPFVKPEPLFISPLKFNFTWPDYNLKGFDRPNPPPPTPAALPPEHPPAPVGASSAGPFDRPAIYRIALILGALSVGAYLTAPRRFQLPPPSPVVTPPTFHRVPTARHYPPRPKRPPARVVPLSPAATPPAYTVQPQPAPGPPIRWYPGPLPPLRNPSQPHGRP